VNTSIENQIFNVMNLSTSKQLEPCYILRPLGYYLAFVWFIGTYLNGSILYIFIRNNKLRQSSTNLFIGGLILADFIGACFEIPLPAIALLNCRLEKIILINNLFRFSDGFLVMLVVYTRRLLLILLVVQICICYVSFQSIGNMKIY
jgi:hypothetical protein